MEQLLAGQTAVVTGSSSGIGRAIARRFAAHGADVVVADIRERPREGGDPTHELIAAETDADAAYVDCDVTDVDDIEAALDRAVEFGGLDVLVNNAGIFRTEEFLDVSPEAYGQLMRVNVEGTFFGAQRAAARMIANGGGNIINVSSIAGIHGNGGYVSYCVSKGAMRLLTYALAHRLGPEGIRVNAIHPGGVETAMLDDAGLDGDRADAFAQQVPQRRLGQPADIAGAALFLASDLAAYVNGESLVVDGGLTNTG